MTLPPNCPLTPEQYARLPQERQNSTTMIWVQDYEHPAPETLDAINAVCDQTVLTALAPLYFATPPVARVEAVLHDGQSEAAHGTVRTTHPASHTTQHSTPETAAVRNGVTYG